MTTVTNTQPKPQTTPRDPDAIPLWEPIVEIVFTSIIIKPTVDLVRAVAK